MGNFSNTYFSHSFGCIFSKNTIIFSSHVVTKSPRRGPRPWVYISRCYSFEVGGLRAYVVLLFIFFVAWARDFDLDWLMRESENRYKVFLLVTCFTKALGAGV